MKRKQRIFLKKFVVFTAVMFLCIGIMLDVTPAYAAGDTAL